MGSGHPLRRLIAAGLVVSIVSVATVDYARAQWRSGGVPVCTSLKNQGHPSVLSDGSGGVFVAWGDNRDSSTTGYDIYLQHLDRDGIPQFQPDGIPVCTVLGDQGGTHLLGDGEGGVIVAWSDVRDGAHSDVYAQRLDGLGRAIWTPGGVRLSTSDRNKYLHWWSTRHALASDGEHGVIVVWDEQLSGYNTSIYAQHIDGSGALLWSSLGRSICGAPDFQLFPTLVSDDRGGAIITWEDWRQNPIGHIYAQHVDADGAPRWPVNGILVSSVTGNDLLPAISSDGAGGAILVWHGNGLEGDIYAQRLGTTGLRWGTVPVPICTASGYQQYATIANDQTGGTLISWDDSRASGRCSQNCHDVYIQRVDSTGTAQWQPNGVPLCTADGQQGPGVAIADAAGGAIVAWSDLRPGGIGIYVQRVDASGNPQWGADGLAVGGRPETQPSVACDGRGGAIIGWSDNRDGTYDEWREPLNMDIYASRVTVSGVVDVVAPTSSTLTLTLARPTPTNYEATIVFDLPSEGEVTVDIYNALGRNVRTVPRRFYSAGRNELRWDGRSDSGLLAPAGLYWLRLTAGGQSGIRRIVLLR